MTTSAPRVSVSWSTAREGNDGYVIEIWTDPDGYTDVAEFGPMPPSTVLAFIHGRRRITSMMMRRLGNRPAPDDFLPRSLLRH